MIEIAEALASYKKQGTYRVLQPMGNLLDFSSNDYLGLSRCSEIRNNLIKKLAEGFPLGATGSRLISGHTEYHERVETFLAKTFKVQTALLFSSGFMANLGVLSAFAHLEAHFFSDELNHASLVQGMKLANSPKTLFLHNDLNDLEGKLKTSKSTLKVIVTESVFSMDGDQAPLADLHELAGRFGAWLVVDEAHATGVFGPSGLGKLDELELHGPQLVSIHTGGKALGGQGAFVLSGQDFRELLINQAPSFIFSTALSPLSALQIEYALKNILKNPSRGQSLLRITEEWKRTLPSQFNTLKSNSQIIPVITGADSRALEVSRILRASGFDIRAIRSPAVPKGTERLRITVKSFHQPNDLHRLLQSLIEATA